ncbi:hypothetical protein [Fulvivirga ligni]|uniref:hypothetical protein n=1 Tax=Fulvivirga ligni TaxID=2904246 RepID=UPI001F3A741D|nr:hypothetical protein [Fulvivirga ligni]UII19627.1 hypothetical protein LVD16_17445 [Fulvivirga ligni]
MKDYSEYTAVDFAMDEDFILWVETGANDSAWQAWLMEHPSQEEAVNEAISMIRAVENDEKYILSPVKNRDLWGRIDGSVQACKKKGIEEQVEEVRNYYRYFNAACGFSGGYLLL